MATEAFVKPVVPNGHDGYDDDEDEDLPLVFRRTSNTASITNGSRPVNATRNSAIGTTKSPPPMRSPLTNSPRPVNATRNSATGSTKSPPPMRTPITNSPRPADATRNSAIASTKSPPPMRSPITNSPRPANATRNSATGSTKSPPPMRSPITNSPRPVNATRNSATGSTMSPPPMRSPLTNSARSSMMKPTLPSSSSVQRSTVKSPLRDDISVVGDSEDDKPLSARLKMDSNQLTKQPNSSGRGSSQIPVQKSNMRPQGVNDNTKKTLLDEKVPMSSTGQTKTSVSTASSKPVHNEQRRPLVNNIIRNGFIPKIEGHSSQVPAKRPLEKGSSWNQSSVKRPKLSEPA